MSLQISTITSSLRNGLSSRRQEGNRQTESSEVLYARWVSLKTQQFCKLTVSTQSCKKTALHNMLFRWQVHPGLQIVLMSCYIKSDLPSHYFLQAGILLKELGAPYSTAVNRSLPGISAQNTPLFYHQEITVRESVL